MRKKYLILPVIFTFFSLLYSEEAYNLSYRGDIGELKDSTITVPDEVVAVSARVKVDMPDDTLIFVGETPSVFFIIDHSRSMSENDTWGKRFTVSLEFIDSIRARFPSTEVGIAVFRQHLYFDPADSSYFIPLTAYPQGAYMPFFKLDSSYINNGGNAGYIIVKNILQIDTVDTLVDLSYIPTNVATNLPSSNINVAFAAAKHAFQSALYEKNRQIIIFLSDGDATEYNGPNTDVWDFVNDVAGLPATFTIFFNSTGQVPQSLVDMTDNIRHNAYSPNNMHSDLWAIDVDTLMNVLMNNVMKVLVYDTIFGKPDSITINGTITGDYNSIDKIFSFDNHFPLTDMKTDFLYRIDYLVPKDTILANGDTIVVQGDTTTEGNFSVVVDPTVAFPPDWYLHSFELIGWLRELGFYYNGNLLDTIYEDMDTVELRFTYDSGDAEYNYTNVDIEVTTTVGPMLDKETYTLTKIDNIYAGSFTRVVIADVVNPSVGDGILQHYKVDTIVANFWNNEIPKLPLDMIRIAAPFKSSTAINPNSYSNKKALSLNIINSSILFNLPTSGKTKLQIYSINGRLISTLVNSYKQAGRYKVNWDSKRYGSGIYYIKLSAGSNTIIQKTIIIK